MQKVKFTANVGGILRVMIGEVIDSKFYHGNMFYHVAVNGELYGWMEKRRLTFLS